MHEDFRNACLNIIDTSLESMERAKEFAAQSKSNYFSNIKSGRKSAAEHDFNQVYFWEDFYKKKEELVMGYYQMVLKLLQR